MAPEDKGLYRLYKLTPTGQKVANHLVFLSHLPKPIRIFFEGYDNIVLFLSCLKDVYKVIYAEEKEKRRNKIHPDQEQR